MVKAYKREYNNVDLARDNIMEPLWRVFVADFDQSPAEVGGEIRSFGGGVGRGNNKQCEGMFVDEGDYCALFWQLRINAGKMCWL